MCWENEESDKGSRKAAAKLLIAVKINPKRRTSIQSSWAGNGYVGVGVGVYDNDNADADDDNDDNDDDDDELNFGKLTKNRYVLWFTANKTEGNGK